MKTFLCLPGLAGGAEGAAGHSARQKGVRSLSARHALLIFKDLQLKYSMDEMVAIQMEPLLEVKPPLPETCLTRLATAISAPIMVLFVSLMFMTCYMTFIALEGGFSSQFLHFGPGTDASNTTSFVGIILDTWPKVYLMYFVSFLSAVMNTYYTYSMSNNLHSYIWNKAITRVPFSRRWTYVVIMSEPFLYLVLSITSFYTNLTMQLQFLIPQFIGCTLMEIPFTFQRLREKEFDFA